MILFSLCVALCLATAVSAAQVQQQTAQPAPSEQARETPRQSAGKPPPQGKQQTAEPAAAQATTASPQESLSFKSIEQVNELTRIGLSGLAMRMIREQQKLYPQYSADWYAFEFKHIETLSALERWQDVINRVDHILARAQPGQQITPKIANWFRTQRAIAQLKLGDPGQALAEARALLWEGRGRDRDRTAFWRRLIIRAYLQMDLAEDANKGLMKYRSDYGDYKTDWKLLQAQALLRAERPAEVVDLLADEESHKARALRLLAAVRSRPGYTAHYIKDINAQLEDAGLTQPEQRAYFYVLYEAALAKKDLVLAAETAEQLLALSRTYAVLGENFKINADALWRLYIELGERAGNQHSLLTGDDIAWYKRAGELQKKEPVRARGMYAVLAFTGSYESKRQIAHKELADSLAETDGGLEVVNQLYMHSDRAGSPENLPVEVRYRLVDHALSVSDITLAATMMASLPEPPQDETYFDWQMRKARVLILEGDYKQGEAVLRASLQNITEINTEMIDRYLQVVFDLQTIKRHEQALELFDLLPIVAFDDTLKREIYYWKAESNYELERYDQAALLYMKSAKAGDETMTDLWAQSARFKASDALLKAGLYDDAQYAYGELLNITSSDSRKRLIRQKLQHIQLLRSSESSGTGQG